MVSGVFGETKFTLFLHLKLMEIVGGNRRQVKPGEGFRRRENRHVDEPRKEVYPQMSQIYVD
jgi:hypothetical protein